MLVNMYLKPTGTTCPFWNKPFKSAVALENHLKKTHSELSFPQPGTINQKRKERSTESSDSERSKTHSVQSINELELVGHVGNFFSDY